MMKLRGIVLKRFNLWNEELYLRVPERLKLIIPKISEGMLCKNLTGLKL